MNKNNLNDRTVKINQTKNQIIQFDKIISCIKKPTKLIRVLKVVTWF